VLDCFFTELAEYDIEPDDAIVRLAAKVGIERMQKMETESPI
jgi:hypothetical protein